MHNESFGPTKLAQLFSPLEANQSEVKDKILELEEKGILPAASRMKAGALWRKGWSREHWPIIGKELGFLPRPNTPKTIAVFTTKGGVLKTTLALNIARTAALHGQRVCVVGLDIQGDITNALGFQSELDEASDLREVMERVQRTRGLMDVFHSKARLSEVIVPVDHNLALIPETPELAHLNDALGNVHRREFWLQEKIVNPLKEHFDLIVLDCSPNWNKLTTNALVAADLLVSPLECKINNFRNFKVFDQFLRDFVQDMRMDLKTIFIPTRFSKQRKLSLDILDWYQKNVRGCTPFGIRDCVLGEEAVALNRSFLEVDPGHAAAIEMKAVLSQIFSRLNRTEQAQHQEEFEVLEQYTLQT